MESQWSHDDLFPIIARAIETLHARCNRFVTHDEIVESLLSDPEAAPHIDTARESAGGERSREWVAHNMVAWFSQRITVGESPWQSHFDRQQIDGKWAYRPATHSNSEALA